jgi:hypothetical protein
MPTVLFVVGLGVTLVGVAMVVLARAKPPPPPATEGLGDLAKIVEEFRKILGLIDKQYRIGVILLAVGLALVGTGAWLEARDANDGSGAVALGACGGSGHDRTELGAQASLAVRVGRSAAGSVS